MSSARELALIAALGRDRVIGRGGNLVFRFKEDLRHFRLLTTGHAIVMGRKTWESIGKPLPQRRNIVLSRDPVFRLSGAETVTSLEQGLALAYADDDCPFVIGGAEIYRLALPLATRLYLTWVDRVEPGDAYFPEFSMEDWCEQERRKGEHPDLTFVTLHRSK